MKALEAKYEEQKSIHIQKIKKQTEELEILIAVLDDVKGALMDRIAKYGEEDEVDSLTGTSSLWPEIKMQPNKNLELGSIRCSSDQLDSDSFSSCSTLALDTENCKYDREDSFQSPLDQVTWLTAHIFQSSERIFFSSS